jgi:hypothetical protein
MDKSLISLIWQEREKERLISNRLRTQNIDKTPSFLGQVFANPNGPTGANQYCWVHPVSVLGEEVEGGAPIVDGDLTSAVPVCVIGSGTPLVGDYLICLFLGNRWVSSLTQSKPLQTGVTLHGCSCTNIPSTLHVSVSGPCDVFFQACELQYGPVPSEFSELNLGTSCFLGTTSLVDSDTGLSFQYHFACEGSFFD